MNEFYFSDKVYALLPGIYDEHATAAWVDGMWERKEQPQYVYHCLSYVNRNFSPAVMKEVYESPSLPCSEIVEAALRLHAGQDMAEIKLLSGHGRLRMDILPERDNELGNLALYTLTYQQERYHFFSNHADWVCIQNPYANLLDYAHKHSLPLDKAFVSMSNERNKDGGWAPKGVRQFYYPVTASVADVLRQGLSGTTAVVYERIKDIGITYGGPTGRINRQWQQEYRKEMESPHPVRAVVGPGR